LLYVANLQIESTNPSAHRIPLAARAGLDQIRSAARELPLPPKLHQQAALQGGTASLPLISTASTLVTSYGEAVAQRGEALPAGLYSPSALDAIGASGMRHRQGLLLDELGLQEVACLD
jgi:hypothetical protein